LVAFNTIPITFPDGQTSITVNCPAPTPARADRIDAAVLVPTCNNFTISVSASGLNPGKSYRIQWSISVKDTCAPPGTATYSIAFTAPSNGVFSATLPSNTFPFNNTFTPQPCPLTFSGTATLVGFNTIPITFPDGQTSMTVNCPAPTPAPTPTPARADRIDRAVLVPTCNSFTISVSASGLNPGQSYRIQWSISVKDTCAPPGTATYGIAFTAPSNGIFSATLPNGTFPLNNTFAPQPCPLTFSGTATLVGFNTIPITFPDGQTSMTVNCPAPTPPGTPTVREPNRIQLRRISHFVDDWELRGGRYGGASSSGASD
jgi:hypothetical protein